MNDTARLTKEDWKEILWDRPLYGKMLRIAVPVSLQMLITVGINLMDTIMLSSMGDAQLSASALAGQLVDLFQVSCMGISMGASVLTARYWGMRDLRSLKKAVTIMLRICLALSCAFAVVTVLQPGALMHLYSNDEAIIVYGSSYLGYMVPCFFCMGLTTCCTVILRSVGLVRIPLLSTIGAFFINVFFNWVFIFGNLGAPRMEIAGAALGTLIARVFELLFICGYFFAVDSRIRYRLSDLAMKCGDLLSEYLRISLPVFVSDTLLALGNNAVAIVMGHIGTAFVSANSVTTVVQRLCSVLTMGISNASGIITGHTMGQGDLKKAQKQGYTFLWIGLVIGCVASLAIFVLRAPLIDYYNVSPQAKSIAWELMDSILIIMVFQSMNSILTKGVLRAGGDTRFLMAGDILFLWILSIPLGYFAGLVWHLPAFWIYMFLKIDQIVKCVWCFFRLKSGKWMKKIRSAQGAQVRGET